MVNGDFYSLEYTYRKSLYTIQTYNITNVIMENIETKEIMIFWESKEIRKHKSGKLITQLSAIYEYECENDALILLNDERMCKKCFETQYNTTIHNLIVKKQDDIIVNLNNLKIN